MKIQAAVASAQGFVRRLDAHETGMMSAACSEKCPGVKNMLIGMMSAPMSTSTTPKPGTEAAATMKMMCPYLDDIACMSANSVCADASADKSSGDPMAMIGCMCACPKLATMGEGDKSLESMCADPVGTVQCLTGNDKCAAMQTMFEAPFGGSQAAFEQMIGLSCKGKTLKCEEKMASIMTTPACATGMSSWTAQGCDKAALAGTLSGDKATTCCPFGAAMVQCATSECMNLQTAVMMLQAKSGTGEAKKEAEGTLKKNVAVGAGCPEVGLVKSEAETKAVAESSSIGAGAGGDASSFAVQAQSASVLAMAAMALAALA